MPLPLIVKNTFALPAYETLGGAVIKDVRIGWESYGTLNAGRSNAVLITHYFSGTSHCAGRYAESDPLPGYWDAIIGPGKAIDTDRYFVIASDTLTNMNVHDPQVVTTGPASIDPATGKPYGLTFPLLRIGDFVRVQKALLDSLGIARLKAVAGPSMGALQAFEWALQFPDMVERIIPAIGAAGGNPFLIAWLDLWAQPVRLDPAWNGGDYYGKEPPLRGLEAALKVVSLHANGPEWARDTFGFNPAVPERDPGAALDNKFAVQTALAELAALRAKVIDANNYLYLIKANQLAHSDPAKITVPTMLVYTPTDLVFEPDWVLRTARAIAGNGTPVDTFVIDGPFGHLNGLACIGQAGAAITAFLEREF